MPDMNTLLKQIHSASTEAHKFEQNKTRTTGRDYEHINTKK